MVLLVSVSKNNLSIVTNLIDPSAEFATDVADVYPTKQVTLVHSRDQLLPRFDKRMHDTGTVSPRLLTPARLLTDCMRQLWTGSAR